jgi:hypothetical protein
MKTLFFLLMAVCTGMCTLSAQQLKADYSVPAAQFNVVVLELTGNSAVLASRNEEVRVKSSLFARGKVWGWKFPADKPPLRILHHVSGDTLYISTPDQFHPAVVGISTYSESLDNTISIPSGKKLIIHGSENLSIEDNFSRVEQSGSGTVSLSVSMTEVSGLKCKARVRLLIDGKLKSGEYELNGKGLEHYQLNADVIKVNFK